MDQVLRLVLLFEALKLASIISITILLQTCSQRTAIGAEIKEAPDSSRRGAMLSMLAFLLQLTYLAGLA
jgi:hypothetical protein